METTAILKFGSGF